MSLLRFDLAPPDVVEVHFQVGDEIIASAREYLKWVKTYAKQTKLLGGEVRRFAGYDSPLVGGFKAADPLQRSDRIDRVKSWDATQVVFLILPSLASTRSFILKDGRYLSSVVHPSQWGRENPGEPKTWTDERGYECGICLCGWEPSTHPDDAEGGLHLCDNCGAVTCSECRVAQGISTLVCRDCAERSNPTTFTQPGLTAKGERMYEHVSYDNRDLKDAIAGYEEFHQWEPKEIGELRGLVIPKRVCVVGEMVQTLYRSDKWENKNHDYFHDHDPGVMIGRTDTTDGEMTDLPKSIWDAKALYLLGQCLGYFYDDLEGQPMEARVSRPLPELYATPDRRALLVIDTAGSKAEVQAVFWGGLLEVKDVGIVG